MSSIKNNFCSISGCENIVLYKINNFVEKYCYKHIELDLYNYIYTTENKLFEYIDNYNLYLINKIKINSYNKFNIFKNDIKKLIKTYKILINKHYYKSFIKKYILFKEYLDYLENLKIDRIIILSKGLILKNYSYYDNIKIVKQKINTNDRFFFKDYSKSIDLLKLEKQKIKDDFEFYSKINNFDNFFSEDIENLIYNYFSSNDNFEKDYYLKCRLNLDFENNIIFYKTKKNNKSKFIILS